MAKGRAVNGAGMRPRKRADGRWEGRVKIGVDPGTGKSIIKYVYAKTAKECQAQMNKLTVEVNEGTYSEPSKMTVAQWLDIWHAEYLGSVKDSTIASYKGHIENNLKPHIGAVKLVSLKAHMIQMLYNKLLKSDGNPTGLSAKSIKNLHGVLHKALKQAMRLGYIKSNPTDACELPRIEKKEVSYLEEDEVKSLLDAIKGHKYESIYKVDLFTGMRQGEILGLTWDCIDFNSGIITIEKQLQREKQKGGRHLLVSNKNDRVRRIKPAEFVMDILKQQRQKQLEDRLRAGGLWSNEWNLVFTNEAGGHLYAITVYKNFKSIVKSIGIPDTRFHDMRHTYAMLSIQNSDDLKTVQENVGHATASFTLDVYGHVSKRMKQDSADRMQDYFNSITSA